MDSSERNKEADSLFDRGMALYRQRQWEKARNCFLRLKELRPEQRGIDAILDELNTFIRLEGMRPEQRAEEALAPPLPVSEEETKEEIPPIPERRRRWVWLVVLPLLLLLTVAIVAAIVRPDLLPPAIRQLYGEWFLTDTQQIEQKRNLGQAYLVAGDYQGAISVLTELLDLVPGDPIALNGLCKAHYERGELLIKELQWDEAKGHLETVAELCGDYRDVHERLAYIEGRKRLEQLFATGEQLYRAEQWLMAVEKLEELREADSSYRAEEVKRFLFDSYINAALELIASSRGDRVQVMDAVVYLERAQSEMPGDVRTEQELQLVERYLTGWGLFDQGRWGDAIFSLADPLAARSDYAGGHAARLLCESHRHLAEGHHDAGALREALEEYRIIVEILQNCASDEDRARATQIAVALTPTRTPTATATPTDAATPTGTPTPTFTGTPTPTPSPTSTSTPIITITPVPTRTPTTIPSPTQPPPEPTARPIEPTSRPPEPTSRPPEPTSAPPTQPPKPPTRRPSRA